jgi:hypothetical protein
MQTSTMTEHRFYLSMAVVLAPETLGSSLGFETTVEPILTHTSRWMAQAMGYGEYEKLILV